MSGEAIPWRPSKWTQPFCSSRVQQGCEAVFEGVVSGCPHPTVKWTWRGKPLEEFTGKAGRHPEDFLFQINPEVTKGSCRPKLKAFHIDSDDYADNAALQGL